MRGSFSLVVSWIFSFAAMQAGEFGKWPGRVINAFLSPCEHCTSTLAASLSGLNTPGGGVRLAITKIKNDCWTKISGRRPVFSTGYCKCQSHLVVTMH